MLILHNAENNRESAEISIAVVFGVGLIGTHLVRNLLKQQYSIIHNLPFSWQTPQQWKREKTDILGCIKNYVTQNDDHGSAHCRGGLYALPSRTGINPAPTNRIDFVWSAGKGGFAMGENDTRPEMDSFSQVVEIALAVLRKNPSCQVRFHMTSSAGGLFEGQRNVNTDTLPAPGRPYAFLKLAQEKILGDCDELIRFIYRPTSVYGFAGLSRRLGLIPTLLWNGTKNKVSTIYGAPETLRDYVWADDIGAFIARMIASKASLSNRFILASGKPSALFEVLNHVEKRLNKKLFRHYIKSGGNAGHNTFSMKTYPVGWKPLYLETGIWKTFNAMLLG